MDSRDKHQQRSQMVAVELGQQPAILREPRKDEEPRFAARTSLGLGIGHCISGFITIVFTVIIAVMYGFSPKALTYLGCGIFYIITGILGICTSKNPKTGLIIATMICSLVSALSALYLIISQLIAVITFWNSLTAGTRALVVSPVLGLLPETVIAIVHVVICSRAVCCRRQPNQPTGVYYAGQAGVPT